MSQTQMKELVDVGPNQSSPFLFSMGEGFAGVCKGILQELQAVVEPLQVNGNEMNDEQLRL